MSFYRYSCSMTDRLVAKTVNSPVSMVLERTLPAKAFPADWLRQVADAHFSHRRVQLP